MTKIKYLFFFILSILYGCYSSDDYVILEPNEECSYEIMDDKELGVIYNGFRIGTARESATNGVYHVFLSEENICFNVNTRVSLQSKNFLKREYEFVVDELIIGQTHIYSDTIKYDCNNRYPGYEVVDTIMNQLKPVLERLSLKDTVLIERN